MDDRENPLEREHCLSVVLPGGLEKNATVHGSKPVMDLLVTLCASYHLNPSDYTVEVLSQNKNNIGFKPNSPIGSLEAEKIVLRPRGAEEKIRRPYMPEATVRLLINYNKSHKAVVRVNPRLPLEMLLPVVCDKCEFKVETTVLLRDSQSDEPLDPTRTLNEHGLREVFAKDTAAHEPDDHRHRARTPQPEIIPPPALQDQSKKETKQKDNAGFLSLFRRKKKKPEWEGAPSAPASPGPKQTTQDVSSSDTLPADTPKKRRAPQPPMGGSLSVPNNLSTCHLIGPQSSGESTLRRTKRRAPPPPCDTQVKGTLDALDELREGDESDSVHLPLSSSSSANPCQPRSSSSFSRPSFDPRLPSFRGRDFSDARCALAKVMTSSVTKGTLVKRLRNSATFPKLYSRSSFMPTTQRSPDIRVFCTELESVLKSKLPTEPEWEDPLQRKAMTTFKVVPSNKQKSHEPEVTLDVPDRCQVPVENNPEREAPLEAEKDENEPEDVSYSAHGSDAETPSHSQELSALEASNGRDSPPSPPDVDNEEREDSPLPEVGGHDEEQKEEDDETEVASEVTADVLSDCGDEKHPIDGEMKSVDQSECLQSPVRRSLSTDMDQRESCTEENEVEDVFPPPPPPIFFNEDVEVAVEGQEDTTASSLPSSRPTSPNCNGQISASSEYRPDESDSPSAAPKPQDAMSAAPSRFAEAVALAVQRSRLQSHGKTFDPQSPVHGSLPSTPRSACQYDQDRKSDRGAIVDGMRPFKQ
ncbi:putative cordon-bleu protein-like 1 isoform 3 [Scophthalmus maximus]|uniref:Putative cordon-bleu protein-like 1 isoform 2 n=1 Tax=Scophthalmus maximus TaxID=52904 RepID=A0A2U9AV76_SCOMX|nr:cordon-bleu protein-like 1 isoform X3 [Scophthalmus maximus]XP_035483661.1 cordon-bleu protein-like 1 isoform X3 [Scophthalmus maximus]AWO95583.1 putative cordon-bleu protein-like 1 isoform 2 [Scophthalmus maximus]AWO95584.1 putative cordon-bleu protein-like 1 isoform 3 [Scophthalmus maximus]